MNLLSDLFDDVTALIKELNFLLSTANVIQSEYFLLPQYSKSDEEALLEHGLQSCHVQHISNGPALETTKEAYLDMFVYDTELSTRFTRKHLGLITVTDHHERIRELVMAINNKKDAFKAEVQLQGDEQEKFNAVHKALPGLVTHTAYRHIPIRENVKALYFNWARRVRSEKVDPKALLEHIQNGTGKAASLTVEERERAMLNLVKHQHHTLRIKRPITVRPECSIKDIYNTLKGTTVGLPIIVLADTKVHFTPLGHYDKLTHKKANIKRYTPVIPKLYLYAI